MTSVMSLWIAHQSRFTLILAGLFCLVPTAARADPCTAPLPAPGTRFSGIVRHVIDGDGLCIGPEGHPDRWIEIRLADFYAPELNERGGQGAKARLATLIQGREIMCVADHRSYDRIVANCSLRGRPIGSHLRASGGREGGRGIRR